MGNTDATRNRARTRTIWSAVAGILALVTTLFVAPSAAVAAPGDLIIEVQAIDGISSDPITELQAFRTDAGVGAEYFYKYNISYVCGPVACPAATVRLSALPLDPYYSFHRFATYSSTSLPGNVVSGNAANGYLVQLGSLAPGTSGSFQVEYRFQQRGVGVDPASFFPDGFIVPMTATLAATGLDPVSEVENLTWRISSPDPRTLVTGPALTRADTDYTYTVYMSPTCQWERSTAGHGEPATECAAAYTVVDTLPTGAVYVSSTNGGVHNPATNTVTWTDSGRQAAIGWGPMNGLGQPRQVTVRFPESIVTGGPSCVIDVTNRVDASVTYLSGAVKTAQSTLPHRVNACEPFGSAVLQGKTSTYDAGNAANPLVWERQTAHYWNVRLDNRANVPGVATITDTFDQAGLSVYSMRVQTGTATFEYTLDNGTTGVAADTTSYTAPTGRTIASVTVTSSPLNGPNLEESSQPNRTQLDVRFYYNVGDNVPDEGWERTNTAHVTMSYPGTDLADIVLGNASYTVTAVPRPAYFRPVIAAAVQGGGLPIEGTPVTYTINASTSDVEPGTPFEGQYVFVAPPQWSIIANSAAIPSATGFSFEYKTVTIAGVTRQAVAATRAPGTQWGANETWPTMTVQATPTASAPGGTVSPATFYMGDARHSYGANTAIWGNNGNFRYADTADLDGDGVTTESYAYVVANVTTGATTALNVLKEICEPNPAQSDGCDWSSNPDAPVGVSPDTTDITYRVTVTNNGTTSQGSVIAYDVLPWVGDTGLTAASASTSRGSTFAETLTLATPGTGVTLAYSASTNPCRPQVYTGGPAGCTDDWSTTAAGAQAIRATIGTLAAGASRTFTYTAAVVGAPGDGDIACNSVAIDSATTAPTEPRPVCARIVAADLAISAPARLPLQEERPGILPFTVVNNGGAETAPASVTVVVPAELTVTSLSFDAWDCTSPDGAAPIAGGTTLTCEPTGGTLEIATPLALSVPVTPAASAASVCVTASIAGEYFDAQLANNDTSACFEVAAGEPELALVKDDGLDSVEPGDEITYTIDVTNALVGEALTDVVVTDELPSTLEFVSATAGGTVSGQAGNGLGGTVSWTIDELLAAAIPSDAGTTGTATEGSSVRVSVTVRVLQSAESVTSITNEASATAADPAGGADLTATDDDVDAVIRSASLSLTKSVLPTTATAAGDEVVYSFLVTNTGTVTLTDVYINEVSFTGSGVVSVSCPAGADSLAPEATVTCTMTYEVTQNDVNYGGIENTATAVGTAPTGVTDPVSEPSSATVTIAADPSIALTKSVSSAVITAAGDVVTYLFEVENTGNVTVYGVAIDEVAFTGAGADVVPVCAAGGVDPGDSITCTATYTVVQADVDAGRIDNTATATALAADMTTAFSDESSAAVVIGADPGISIVKSATPTDLVVDQLVTYSFVVTNTGNVTLTGVGIDEVDFTGTGALSAVTCDAAAAALAPDAQTVCQATYVITQDDVDAGTLANTATATGLAPGGPITSEESSVSLPFEQDAELAVVKTADVDGFDAAGDALEYRFQVTNTGNVTLTGIAIDEQEFSGTGDLSAIECPATSILPGQRVVCVATYTVTQADVDAGGVANSATALGVAPGDEALESEPSEVEVPFVGEEALGLTKIGTPVDVDGDGRITVKDRIRWSFQVTNLGATTLTDLAVSDPMAGDIVCDADVLPPGATVDCEATAEYQITAEQAADGRVVNIATASAAGVGSVTVDSDEATAVVAVAAVGGLASTGLDVRVGLVAALLALLLGAGALVLRRRRITQP